MLVPFVLATVIAGRCRRPGGADPPQIAAGLLLNRRSVAPILVIFARGDDTARRQPERHDRRDQLRPCQQHDLELISYAQSNSASQRFSAGL